MKEKSWLFEMINEINKPLAKLTEIRRPTLIKLEMKKVALQQLTLKFRSSLGNILKTYTPINWKSWKKLISRHL
jgi:hypothetical protein